VKPLSADSLCAADVCRARQATRGVAIFTLLLLSGTMTALAAECTGNPKAIGTSRTLVVDPREHPRVGIFQYQETLPLADHEVVLTFDDGPMPPHTARILDLLASNCVKATFFVVGRMAKSSPDLLRRAYNDGHTIGTHSENHPMNMAAMPVGKAEREIEAGIASVTSALGGNATAPFFRFPGFERSDAVEQYLEAQGIMVWSADIVVGDWELISPDRVVERTMAQLNRAGRGIVLLHDIHGRTARALPKLLDRLKLAGFRVVHIEPAAADRPKTETGAAEWAAPPGKRWTFQPGTSRGVLHPPKQAQRNMFWWLGRGWQGF
jgi:peptidoglycan-N-acetylglucosamine deacetylase